MTAGALVHAVVPIVENLRLARDTFRLRFRCAPLAATIRPGQFIMLRLPDRADPLLGRAFALYDTADDAVDIVYLVAGKLTALLAGLRRDDRVEVWGPLGNGFPDYSGTEHLVLVAGGIGQTPFLSLILRALGRRGYGGQAARQEAQRVSLYYGVRTAELIAGVEDFEAAGTAVHLASDDGSAGFRGFVTQLLDQHPQSYSKPDTTRWVGCGPEPMMHVLADLAQRRGIRCDLSLETPMACGVGICFSCVAKVKTGSSWDYRRVCVEGPVFDAAELVW